MLHRHIGLIVYVRVNAGALREEVLRVKLSKLEIEKQEYNTQIVLNVYQKCRLVTFEKILQ